MEDREIVELYWKRSEQAISAAAEKYGCCCRAVAYRILGDRRDAEECVNDAYFSAWNAIPPARPDNFGAFLVKITRNAALNRRQQNRAKKRGGGQTELALTELEECVSTVTSVEQGVEDGLLTAALENFLYAQPQPKRNIFIRRYWYLSPLRDIAREYGMSQSKVKSLLFRMRKELKAYLEKEEILL